MFKLSHAVRTIAVLTVLTADLVFCSTCPTFTTWLHVDNEVDRPLCGYGPCNNLDGFASIDVAPDASFLIFTVQISNSRDFITASSTDQLKPFSSAIPGSMTAYVFGPAVPGREVDPGTAPLLAMDLNPPTLSMGTSVTRAQLMPSNLDVVLGYIRTGNAYVNIITDRVLKGELRGQLGVPICYEAAVEDARTGGYAYVNVLVPAARDALAVLVRTPSDYDRAFKSAGAAAPVAFVRLSSEPNANAQGAMGCTKVSQAAQWKPLVNTTFCLQGADFLRDSSGPDLGRAYRGEVNAEGDARPPVYYVRHKMPGAVVSDAALSAMRAAVFACAQPAPGAAACTDVAGPAAAALAPEAPCRRLLTLHDSLFTLARQYRSDWVTVWSMNDGGPDVRRTLEPRYYAHPYKINKGETSFAIQRRFGMSAKELLLDNPGLAGLDSLPVGDAVCVVPNWARTMAGSGQPICTPGVA